MAENFVFVLHPDELESHFDKWKEKVYLAIHYNSEEDEASFLLFREEEFHNALEKFSKGIPIIPEYDGFPTGKISFGTESKIIRMVVEQENLPELAQDYSMNFDFELENKEQDNSLDYQVNDTLSEEDQEIETVVVETSINDEVQGTQTDLHYEHLVSHHNDNFHNESNQASLDVSSSGYFTNTGLKNNLFKVRKHKGKVEFNLGKTGLNLIVDSEHIKYSLDGRSLLIPFSEHEENASYSINISEVPENFKSDLSMRWQNFVYEVTNDGVVAYKTNTVVNSIPHQKAWMFATVFLAFLSFVGFLTSYSTFHNAEKIASEALSLAETVNEKSTLKVDMNPVYLNELRNALLSQEDIKDEE